MKVSRVVAAAAAVLMACAAPVAAQQAPVAPSQQGQMSDSMVQKVGAALRHVAMIRQQYSQRAQSVGSTQERQTLSDQAKTDMMKAIGDQGLSVQQYDEAIQMAQNDATLKQRLVSAAQSGK